MTIRLNVSGSYATNATLGTFVSETRGNARALPTLRRGSQAYFWTEEWQHRETLADIDFLAGNVYEPSDVDDLVRFLDEAAATTDAETS